MHKNHHFGITNFPEGAQPLPQSPSQWGGNTPTPSVYCTECCMCNGTLPQKGTPPQSLNPVLAAMLVFQ